jgi:hypothetical protein
MGLACKEIRDAIDGFAVEQRARRRLPTLLARTDAMLAELEISNLLGETRASACWRSDLTSLVSDLPFEYESRMGHDLSPTAAIDLVFDIQGGLFRLMADADPDDECLETAG